MTTFRITEYVPDPLTKIIAANVFNAPRSAEWIAVSNDGITLGPYKSQLIAGRAAREFIVATEDP